MIFQRNISQKALKYLDSDEILLFIGARQAGKTTILKQLRKKLDSEQKQTFFLNLEDPDYLRLLNQSPKELFQLISIDLKKRATVFIDEIQYLDNPSNFLKYFYDEYAGKIKLIVSGSSAFYIDTTFKDSLAGRKKIFHVHTLSFPEFLRFKGEQELSQKNLSRLSLTEKEHVIRLYAEYLLYGGYPRVVLAPFSEKQELIQEIAFSYIKKDIIESGVRKDEVFYQLFKLLASQVGGLVNASELSQTLGTSKTAIDHYLYIMQKSFHISLIKPFYRNARKELTKMPKVYFHDLGLRNFFVNNFTPLDLREDRGAVFENAVFRQLMEKNDETNIHFWRTLSQQEVDFVLKEKAYEVKVNLRQLKHNSYRSFVKQYPELPLEIVSWNTSQDDAIPWPVKSVWEL